MSAASHDPEASATATVPTISPGHRPQEPLALLSDPAARRAGTNWPAVARKGAGAQHPAELLAHHGQLHEAEADTAVGLGDGERRPVELDHAGPQLLGPLPSSTTVRTSDGGHSRSRTARTDVLQLALVVGQFQVQ
jgi:hypothetical protein